MVDGRLPACIITLKSRNAWLPNENYIMTFSIVTFKRVDLCANEDGSKNKYPLWAYDLVKDEATRHPDILEDMKLAKFPHDYMPHLDANSFRITKRGPAGLELWSVAIMKPDANRFVFVLEDQKTKKECIEWINLRYTAAEFDFSNAVDCIGRPYFIDGDITHKNPAAI